MPKSRDDFFIGHEETYTDRRIKIHVANEKLAKFGVTSFLAPWRAPKMTGKLRELYGELVKFFVLAQFIARFRTEV